MANFVLYFSWLQEAIILHCCTVLSLAATLKYYRTSCHCKNVCHNFRYFFLPKGTSAFNTEINNNNSVLHFLYFNFVILLLMLTSCALSSYVQVWGWCFSWEQWSVWMSYLLAATDWENYESKQVYTVTTRPNHCATSRQFSSALGPEKWTPSCQVIQLINLRLFLCQKLFFSRYKLQEKWHLLARFSTTHG